MKGLIIAFLVLGGIIFYFLSDAQTALMDAERANNEAFDIFEAKTDCMANDLYDCIRVADHFRELALVEKDLSKKIEYAEEAEQYLSSSCRYNMAVDEGCMRLGHFKGNAGKRDEAMNAYKKGCQKGTEITCQWRDVLEACDHRREQAACDSLKAAWSVAQ